MAFIMAQNWICLVQTGADMVTMHPSWMASIHTPVEFLGWFFNLGLFTSAVRNHEPKDVVMAVVFVRWVHSRRGATTQLFEHDAKHVHRVRPEVRLQPEGERLPEQKA